MNVHLILVLLGLQVAGVHVPTCQYVQLNMIQDSPLALVVRFLKVFKKNLVSRGPRHTKIQSVDLRICL